MVNFCAVFGCSHRSDRDNVSFYRFPHAPERYKASVKELTMRRRQRWFSVIRRKDLTNDSLKNARVCSVHFVNGKPAALADENNPDWVPRLLLGYSSTEEKKTRIAIGRFNRVSNRQDKLQVISPSPCNSIVDTTVDITPAPSAVDEESNINESEVSYHPELSKNEPSTRSIGCQTNLSGDDLTSIDDELRRTNREVYRLRDVISERTLSQENFEKDVDKTRFYTGITDFALLMVLVNNISAYLTETPVSVLTKFQQCLLFFMKLRLNFKYQDLAYRFNVSNNTASRAFHNVLDVFYNRYKYIVRWPSRDELYSSMPVPFIKEFGKNVAIIIDCFEVFIEKPSNLMAKCQTWSSYKHHNTVKLLIGICPQGAITYISEGWGGRVSDKHLTQECGILKKLIPGDIVMADRGFNISEEVGFHYAKVEIPAFTRGKMQLSPLDVEHTRKIASLRIHVERVIGLTRSKYNILNGPLPREMLVDNGHGATIDKIVMCACALTSICPSVVPLD